MGARLRASWQRVDLARGWKRRQCASARVVSSGVPAAQAAESSLTYGDPLEPTARRSWSYRPRRWSVIVALGLAVVIVGSVATDLVHRANGAGRLSDLRSYYQAEESGVGSCAGGLHDSLAALQAVLTGVSRARVAAAGIASLGAQACMPLTDEDLYDMETSAPPRSLANYVGVATAGDDVYTWAYPNAAGVQTEVVRVLRDHASPTSASARMLYRQLLALRRAGQQIQGLFNAAAVRLHGRLTPFSPSIVLAPPAALGPTRARAKT